MEEDLVKKNRKLQKYQEKTRQQLLTPAKKSSSVPHSKPKKVTPFHDNNKSSSLVVPAAERCSSGIGRGKQATLPAWVTQNNGDALQRHKNNEVLAKENFSTTNQVPCNTTMNGTNLFSSNTENQSTSGWGSSRNWGSGGSRNCGSSSKDPLDAIQTTKSPNMKRRVHLQ